MKNQTIRKTKLRGVVKVELSPNQLSAIIYSEDNAVNYKTFNQAEINLLVRLTEGKRNQYLYYRINPSGILELGDMCTIQELKN